MKFRHLAASVAALVLTAALAAPAAAQSHPGHDPARTCNWQADVAPQFVPGSSVVNDAGLTRVGSDLFNTTISITAWDVVVLPGYQFGWVYAWDEGVPDHASCMKSYARSSIYGVYKTVDCCYPQRTVKPTLSATFQVRARQLNDPGEAVANAYTLIHAANTGMTCVAAAGTSTRSGDNGVPVSVQIPLPAGGNFRLYYNIDFDTEESSVDSASSVSVGPARAAPDEEYGIVTDLELSATADGAPWDTGEATADLMQHTLWIRTVVECRHCSQKWTVDLIEDAQFWGITEKSATGD